MVITLFSIKGGNNKLLIKDGRGFIISIECGVVMKVFLIKEECYFLFNKSSFFTKGCFDFYIIKGCHKVFLKDEMWL